LGHLKREPPLFTESLKLSKVKSIAGLFSPALVTAFIWANFYKDTAFEITPEEALPILLLMEAMTFVVMFVTLFLVKEKNRVAVILSAGIVYFFSYQTIKYWLYLAWCLCRALTGANLDAAFPRVITPAPFVNAESMVPVWNYLVVYLLIGAALLYAVGRRKWRVLSLNLQVDFDELSGNLFVILAILIAFNVVQLCMSLSQIEANAKDVSHDFLKLVENMHFDQIKDKPDVYYIIVDGFASPETINDWGVNDQQIWNDLKAAGFYVVPRAACNYDRTQFSVASSLSMQYLDAARLSGPKNEFQNLHTYIRVMQDSAVVRLFKQLNYRFINLGSTPVNFIARADENVNYQPWDYFGESLASLTPLMAVESQYPLISALEAQVKLSTNQQLPSVVETNGPKFVLMHSQLPHWTILFDAKGRLVPVNEHNLKLFNWGTPFSYYQQWRYSSTVLKGWIDEILKKPGPKPIIIVQSDHGPTVVSFKNDDEYYNQHMRILNAYYFPGQSNKGLYPTITPVNSFRVLFNDYFNAHLPILPDKVICSPDPVHFNDISDVRSRLHFHLDPSPTAK
jgi:hypothetical protein